MEISTFDDVFWCFTDIVCQKAPPAQDKDSKSIFPTTWGFLLINASAVALVIHVLITHPRWLCASKQVPTIESSCPRNKERPIVDEYLTIVLFGSLFSLEVFFNSASNFFWKEHTLLSFKV